MPTSSAEGSPTTESTAAPYVLGGILLLFMVVIGYLVVGAVTPREAAEFTPTPIEASAQAESLVIDTVTIDARDASAWQWFSFGTQSVVASPAAGWDLGFRRFDVIAVAGAQNLGPMAFSEVMTAPETAYTPTQFEAESTAVVFDGWYAYNLLTHLLEPQGNVYVMETQDGGHAKLLFLSYYCPKLEAGCITFAYAYQPDGSGRFDLPPG